MSQGCRRYTPGPKEPCHTPSPHPEPPCSTYLGSWRGGGVALPPARGVAGPPKPCRAPGGGAATLASVALHFDTKVASNAVPFGTLLQNSIGWHNPCFYRWGFPTCSLAVRYTSANTTPLPVQRLSLLESAVWS